VEKERAEKERAEKERVEKERVERERVEKERAEKERVEKERAEKERAEKERIEAKSVQPGVRVAIMPKVKPPGRPVRIEIPVTVEKPESEPVASEVAGEALQRGLSGIGLTRKRAIVRGFMFKP